MTPYTVEDLEHEDVAMTLSVSSHLKERDHYQME